jgi:flagellar biosynthesis protein FlhB
MSDDRSQKNFDPTPARKLKARRDGNVARSSEVGAIAAFACGAAGTFAVVPFVGAAGAGAIAGAATWPNAGGVPLRLTLLVALSLVPAGSAAAGALAAGLLQSGGLRVNAPKLQFARLNPVEGLKRMAGGEAAVGARRAIVAFAIVTAALAPLAAGLFESATTLVETGALAALAFDGMQRACWAALGAGAIFAAADYALVRRRWLRGLKMTFDELRRDQKENDGDPQARSRRKTLHRALVRGSIARTKDASFVVVNPTHIAIAIRYAPPDVPVPEILVRAADDGAQAVRELARRLGIPIVENIALARALFAQGEAGGAIPSPTFVAVARVIAELMRAGALE